MESTAQYWKPVWEALERHWKPPRQKREGVGRMSGTLHLAQAQSNRGPRGRKSNFPDAEQRLWRTVTRRKYQLTRDRARLQNQVESLLEEAHIKLSSLAIASFGSAGRQFPADVEGAR